MKIVMFYDNNLKDLGDLTSRIAENYCSVHKYDFSLFRKRLDGKRSSSWSKLLMIKQEMFSTDWIVWIDADILIMNHDFDVYSLLKSKKRDMYVSTDFNGLCTGFFILRNCEWSRNLLDAWMFLGPLKGDWYIEFDQMRKPGEQNTFKCMYKYFSGVKERVDLIPEEVVSNPRTVVNNVPFAHHYWCNGLNKDVIKKIHSFQRKGWSPECI